MIRRCWAWLAWRLRLPGYRYTPYTPPLPAAYRDPGSRWYGYDLVRQWSSSDDSD